MGRNNLAGAWGEALAARYLEKKRYKLVAANYRSRFGEIDLIVCDRKYLVFVEVKYRSSRQAGTALEAINWRKAEQVRRVAAFYLYQKHYPENTPVRFDAAGIDGEQITYIKNAF